MTFEEKFRDLLATPVDAGDREGFVLQQYAIATMNAFSIANRKMGILLLHKDHREDMDESTSATVDRLVAELDQEHGVPRRTGCVQCGGTITSADTNYCDKHMPHVHGG